MTGIHGLEAQDIAKKRAVRLSVLAIDDHVRAINHSRLLNNPGDSGLLRVHGISKDSTRIKTGHYHGSAGSQ
jgi:hypothetical protein